MSCRTRATRILLAGLVGLALTTGVSAAPSEAASASSTVKSLISKIVKSKKPRKTYQALSSKQRAMVKKELGAGTVQRRWLSRGGTSTLAVPAAGSIAPAAIRRCWQRSQEARYIGGITRAALFTTTNTTRVCATGGRVYSVSVVESFQDTAGVGWHTDGVTKSKLDVGWEGRGVSRGSFDFGAAGWVLMHRTLCSQVRLNSDFIHYAGSTACSVNA